MGRPTINASDGTTAITTSGANVTIAGNLTITGATTTTSSTNTTIADKLVELGTGSSGSASGDVGHIFERGDDANVFIGWDESADTFIAATGTFTGSTTGNLSLAGYAAAKFGSLTLTTTIVSTVSIVLPNDSLTNNRLFESPFQSGSEKNITVSLLR